MAKKVFISLPLANKSVKSVREAWNSAIEQVRDYLNEPFEVIQSLLVNNPPKEIKSASLWYLGYSLQKLAEADIAYFSRGWQTAQGCKIEYEAAWEYDIDVLTFDGVWEVLEHRKQVEAENHDRKV